ncbi:unknown [Bacteroides thetaiotaomicron CAG:40]|nr:unknown [Bacteroides thetaiotaomicron CAG:40]
MGLGIEYINTSPVCPKPYLSFTFNNTQYNIIAKRGITSCIKCNLLSITGKTTQTDIIRSNPHSLFGINKHTRNFYFRPKRRPSAFA